MPFATNTNRFGLNKTFKMVNWWIESAYLIFNSNTLTPSYLVLQRLKLNWMYWSILKYEKIWFRWLVMFCDHFLDSDRRPWEIFTRVRFYAGQEEIDIWHEIDRNYLHYQHSCWNKCQNNLISSTFWIQLYICTLYTICFLRLYNSWNGCELQWCSVCNGVNLSEPQASRRVMAPKVGN